mmetsp:Transcript_5724/g.13699  ORF Transcript_5724/g.13699 Transcript_5724/m.13699 type:complete len:783 (+) Transcript_5724:139-2487(+)
MIRSLSIVSLAIVASIVSWIPSTYSWSGLHRHRQFLSIQNANKIGHTSRYSFCHCKDFGKARNLQTNGLYSKSNDEDDEEDDDDDDPPEVDIRDFRIPSSMDTSFGLGKGRSSPNQRKAMGSSSKTSTTVFICSNCGSESVQWRGRCPTCKEWNTFQEVEVKRSNNSGAGGPVGGAAHNLLSGRSSTPDRAPTRTTNNQLDGQSWLDGISGERRYEGNRPVSISDIDLNKPNSGRLQIPNDEEMNEVLGGGLMKGSLILLGGDPGVGKSTLALQMAAQVASLSAAPVGVGMGPTAVRSEVVGPVWYVSGEETLEQIATRAQRLIEDQNDNEMKESSARFDSLPEQLFLLSETNLNALTDDVVQNWINEKNFLEAVDNDPSLQNQLPPNPSPSLIVIDSIQTMVCEAGGSSSAGGISQVRESMALLLRLAKTTKIPILTIGHVTKSGDVAGPRMVEHMVDAVLYLEHSQSSSASSLSNGNFRWLRAQKNRFGSCQVAGLYDFRDGILVPLPEGTESALAPPSDDLEGCSMGICVEGPHRAMTVEVQALVTLASNSFGKKTVEGGLSSARLNLLLGILQKHCQLNIGGGGKISRDVYVNVVGCEGTVSKSQLHLATMALDLAVTVALTSSYLRIPARGDTACLAQVGLLGELRPLTSLEARLLQAQRMGFSSVIVASTNHSSRKSKKKKGSVDPVGEDIPTRSTRKYGLDIYECSTLKQALNLALTSPIPQSKFKRSNRQQNNGSTAGSGKKPGYKTSSPGSLQELNLDDEVILDDEDDEYDLI